eukprot:TRINITY_DN8466_c0_g1_i1.p2 TRINITY_DN8466_c0_g1~~TRINITY_DN8466_c0_g1_i1.p2  ORF type:complete len:190 (-),score=24.73 TRINITY_DN8466_c0_g1_i1:67-636(-)
MFLNIGYNGDDYIGKISLQIRKLPFGVHSMCFPLVESREIDFNEAPPRMCFTFEHAKKTAVGKSEPRLKLIDFAHFFSAASLSSDWPKDGVHEGLLSAIGELDYKILSAATYQVTDDGRRMECPDTSAQHFSSLVTLDTCRNYGRMRKNKYITWLATEGEFGNCCACDLLIPQRATSSAGSVYHIVTLS